MIQIGMAGENIGLADGLGILTRVPVEQKTLLPVKNMVFQLCTVAGGFAKGQQQRTVMVDQLNRQVRECLQISQNCPQALFRDKCIDTFFNFASRLL